jgi:hypothetical protein
MFEALLSFVIVCYAVIERVAGQSRSDNSLTWYHDQYVVESKIFNTEELTYMCASQVN